MLMPWPEPILKRLQNTKREVMARPVELLYFSGETECGTFIPLLVMVNCGTEIEGRGWCDKDKSCDLQNPTSC